MNGATVSRQAETTRRFEIQSYAHGRYITRFVLSSRETLNTILFGRVGKRLDESQIVIASINARKGNRNGNFWKKLFSVRILVQGNLLLLL